MAAAHRPRPSMRPCSPSTFSWTLKIRDQSSTHELLQGRLRATLHEIVNALMVENKEGKISAWDVIVKKFLLEVVPWNGHYFLTAALCGAWWSQKEMKNSRKRKIERGTTLQNFRIDEGETWLKKKTCILRCWTSSSIQAERHGLCMWQMIYGGLVSTISLSAHYC